MSALSASTAWRFSSRKYSPRGFAPVGRTRNAVSEVGAGTRVRAAEAALQDVVPHLQEWGGVARQRILRLISRRQRTAVRPQMVLRSAFRSALTADRGLHEKHQTDHTAGRVVAELC